MEVNDDAVGRNVDETLRLIKAFEYADEVIHVQASIPAFHVAAFKSCVVFVLQHGEVCPANWKPGDLTMKPDPEGSKAYFRTLPADL